jgi:hypothetical protein
MDVTLVLPPLTQLNTPYPSISYLARHLRRHGIDCAQRDLGIELVHSLFSHDGLDAIFDAVERREELPEPAWRMLAERRQHLRAIEPVLAFLGRRDATLASRILDTPLLPRGPRLAAADTGDFGAMGRDDAARHLATLYLDDLADLVTATIDEGFGITRYQAHLATGMADFRPLWQRLHQSTLVDEHIDRLTDTLTGDVVGLSVPFPGNLYAALRIGRRLRARGAYVVLGGGYVNTELRKIDEPRLWECVDAVTYDDGEGPLMALLEHLDGGADRRHRTRTAEGFFDAIVARPVFECAADYEGLDLDLYLDTIDTLNPAHRLWADGRWNKITVAHGCYWKRCTFCDVSLDYIAGYEQAGAVRLADEIERLVAATGRRGFHFVDEAAPPAALKALALELLRRDLTVALWGNIRFEKAFTPDLCRLLAAAGVVAVTGGLETASDRLLELIDKGVTVDQVARSAAAFRDAGILVHAYLMYGFPTQSEQETIDSMEVVRQLFAGGLVNSAFWHRFVLTRHAPVHADPAHFGIRIVESDDAPRFARNDVAHEDPTGADHDLFDEMLPLALDHWMRGRELARPVHRWFERRMPPTTVAADRIARALEEPWMAHSERGELVWTGTEPLVTEDGIVVFSADDEASMECDEAQAERLCDLIERATPSAGDARLPTLAEARAIDAFTDHWPTLRRMGLLCV